MCFSVYCKFLFAYSAQAWMGSVNTGILQGLQFLTGMNVQPEPNLSSFRLAFLFVLGCG